MTMSDEKNLEQLKLRCELAGFVPKETAGGGFWAAETAFWSWAELFKRLEPQKPEYTFGWYLAQALWTEMKRLKRENVPDLKSYHIGIDGLRRDHYGSRAIEQADSIEDPVIHALLRFGTIRALTDILPHLIVRQDNPVELLYYTADDIKRDGGPNLYEINKEWGEVLQNRSANGRCVPGVELS